jgi:hypothetical protein
MLAAGTHPDREQGGVLWVAERHGRRGHREEHAPQRG